MKASIISLVTFSLGAAAGPIFVETITGNGEITSPLGDIGGSGSLTIDVKRGLDLGGSLNGGVSTPFGGASGSGTVTVDVKRDLLDLDGSINGGVSTPFGGASGSGIVVIDVKRDLLDLDGSINGGVTTPFGGASGSGTVVIDVKRGLDVDGSISGNLDSTLGDLGLSGSVDINGNSVSASGDITTPLGSISGSTSGTLILKRQTVAVTVTEVISVLTNLQGDFNAGLAKVASVLSQLQADEVALESAAAQVTAELKTLAKIFASYIAQIKGCSGMAAADFAKIVVILTTLMKDYVHAVQAISAAFGANVSVCGAVQQISSLWCALYAIFMGFTAEFDAYFMNTLTTVLVDAQVGAIALFLAPLEALLTTVLLGAL